MKMRTNFPYLIMALSCFGFIFQLEYIEHSFNNLAHYSLDIFAFNRSTLLHLLTYLAFAVYSSLATVKLLKISAEPKFDKFRGACVLLIYIAALMFIVTHIINFYTFQNDMKIHQFIMDYHYVFLILFFLITLTVSLFFILTEDTFETKLKCIKKITLKLSCMFILTWLAVYCIQDLYPITLNVIKCTLGVTGF